MRVNERIFKTTVQLVIKESSLPSSSRLSKCFSQSQIKLPQATLKTGKSIFKENMGL